MASEWDNGMSYSRDYEPRPEAKTDDGKANNGRLRCYDRIKPKAVLPPRPESFSELKQKLDSARAENSMLGDSISQGRTEAGRLRRKVERVQNRIEEMKGELAMMAKDRSKEYLRMLNAIAGTD